MFPLPHNVHPCVHPYILPNAHTSALTKGSRPLQVPASRPLPAQNINSDICIYLSSRIFEGACSHAIESVIPEATNAHAFDVAVRMAFSLVSPDAVLHDCRP